MEARHRQGKAGKTRAAAGTRARKVRVGLLRGSIVQVVGREIHALMVGDPSIVVSLWEKIRPLLHDHLC